MQWLTENVDIIYMYLCNSGEIFLHLLPLRNKSGLHYGLHRVISLLSTQV